MAGLNRIFGYAFTRPAVPNATNEPLGLAPGALITVYERDAAVPLTLATLYSDSSAVTPLANPFVADDNAYYDFYCAPIRLDVQFSGGGIVTPYTLGDAGLPLLPAYTTAELPILDEPNAGVLVRLTDGARGLWQATVGGFSPVSPVIDPRDFGAVGDGVTDDSAAFTAAIAVALTTGFPVTPPAATYRFSADVTVTSGVELDATRGAVFTVDAGKTLTITGGFSCSPRTVFTGSGTITFGSGAILAAFAEWFGAVRDGVTDDSTAINAALAAIPAGGTVQLLLGTYAIATTIANVKTCTLQGLSEDDTMLLWTGGAAIALDISLSFARTTVQLLEINNSGTATIGVQVAGTHTTLRRLRANPLAGFATAIIATNNVPLSLLIEDCHIDGRNGALSPIALSIGPSNNAVIQNCQFDNHVVTIKIDEGAGVIKNVSILNNYFDLRVGNTYGIQIVSAEAPTILGNHLECQDAANRAIRLETVNTGALIGNWIGAGGQAPNGIEIAGSGVQQVVIIGNYGERIASGGGHGYLVECLADGSTIWCGPNGRNSSNTSGILEPTNADTDVPVPYVVGVSGINAEQGLRDGQTAFTISVNDNANFSMPAPSNPTKGQFIVLKIRNISGGAMGTISWNAVYKLAVWTNPADGNSRSITFEYDGTNWIETGRTPADVPN